MRHRQTQIVGQLSAGLVLWLLVAPFLTDDPPESHRARAQAVSCATATPTRRPANPTPRIGDLTCVGALGVASEFTVFLLGDYTASFTDSEGRVSVGGNVNFNGFGVGDRLPNSHGTRDDLIVGG